MKERKSLPWLCARRAGNPPRLNYWTDIKLGSLIPKWAPSPNYHFDGKRIRQKHYLFSALGSIHAYTQRESALAMGVCTVLKRQAWIIIVWHDAEGLAARVKELLRRLVPYVKFLTGIMCVENRNACHIALQREGQLQLLKNYKLLFL